MSGKRVRTYYVSAEFWADQPEAAARILARETGKHPGDLWIVAIGTLEDRRWLDDLMFNYGRVIEIEPEAPS